jgi:hypothetical protein
MDMDLDMDVDMDTDVNVDMDVDVNVNVQWNNLIEVFILHCMESLRQNGFGIKNCCKK